MSDADRTNTLDLSSAERAEEANRINTLNLSPAEREARHDADVAYAAMGNGVGAMAMVDAALEGGLLPTMSRSAPSCVSCGTLESCSIMQ